MGSPCSLGTCLAAGNTPPTLGHRAPHPEVVRCGLKIAVLLGIRLGTRPTPIRSAMSGCLSRIRGSQPAQLAQYMAFWDRTALRKPNPKSQRETRTVPSMSKQQLMSANSTHSHREQPRVALTEQVPCTPVCSSVFCKAQKKQAGSDFSKRQNFRVADETQVAEELALAASAIQPAGLSGFEAMRTLL